VVSPPPADSHAHAIFLIDGWASFRRSLRLFLEASGHRVAGEADTVERATEMEALRSADVIVVEPILDRSELEWDLRAIGVAAPAARVVLLSSIAVPVSGDLVLRMVQLGVAAYLTKADGPRELLRAIQAALSGELVVLPPQLLAPATDHVVEEAVSPEKAQAARRLDITRRELEILTLAAHSYSDRQIAQILWVADQTVKFHLANLCRKLGVRSRAEAVAAARRLGAA
jgi:DNA-binding NarL/FixJ family response regulator